MPSPEASGQKLCREGSVTDQAELSCGLWAST